MPKNLEEKEVINKCKKVENVWKYIINTKIVKKHLY